MTTPQTAGSARRYVVEVNALDTTTYLVFDEYAGTDELRDEPVYDGTQAECDAVANALNNLHSPTPASAGALTRWTDLGRARLHAVLNSAEFHDLGWGETELGDGDPALTGWAIARYVADLEAALLAAASPAVGDYTLADAVRNLPLPAGLNSREGELYDAALAEASAHVAAARDGGGVMGADPLIQLRANLAEVERRRAVWVKTREQALARIVTADDPSVPRATLVKIDAEIAALNIRERDLKRIIKRQTVLTTEATGAE